MGTHKSTTDGEIIAALVTGPAGAAFGIEVSTSAENLLDQVPRDKAALAI